MSLPSPTCKMPAPTETTALAAAVLVTASALIWISNPDPEAPPHPPARNLSTAVLDPTPQPVQSEEPPPP